MKIQAISADFKSVNSNAKGVLKAHSNPLGLKQDVFEHQNGPVNFKGADGAVLGGATGAGVALLLTGTAIATGGIGVLPFVLIYYGSTVLGGCIGTGIEDKIDEIKNKNKDKKE